MQVSLLSLCPKSWKVLFLLKENEISFEFKTLPLNEKKALFAVSKQSFVFAKDVVAIKFNKTATNIFFKIFIIYFDKVTVYLFLILIKDILFL